MFEIKQKIAVLVSGSGSNLQAIIDSIENEELDCEISYVIADRPCYALKRAEKHKIKNIMTDRKLLGEKLSDEIDKILENNNEKTSYIILAGYLSILSEKFIRKWEKKIINIHPSLLPKYGGKGMYGLKVHDLNKMSELQYGVIPSLEKQLAQAETSEGKEMTLLRYRVTDEEIVEVLFRACRRSPPVAG